MEQSRESEHRAGLASVPDATPWVAGRGLPLGEHADLRDPWDGTPVTRVAVSTDADVRAAIDAAVDAQKSVAALATHERAAILRRAADLVTDRADRYAINITRQTGKARKNALREVRRAAWTMRAAATAAETHIGSAPVADAAPEHEGVLAVTVWEPIGVVGAITPFNAPFNLVTHKVAPAFAAGNAIVVKPASQAPLSALDVAGVMEEAGAPAGAINVVPGNRQTVAALLDDARVGMYTLTGSRDAGEAVVRGARLRRVTLELGGNSPNIVHRDASLEMAAAACVRGGFANTGQSCNSVQRVIVHREIVDAFTARVVELTRDLVVGDPMDPATDVGTLVDEAAAARIEVWLTEAGQAGARVLVGGERQGAQLRPSVVTNAPLDARLVCEEVFGPVVVVLPYDELEEAIELANGTPFGLQAAIFTDSLDVALRAARGLQAGGVLVNRSTNYRLDHLPYGGVKDSGIGREGPRHAIEEMSELKLVVFGGSGASG
ncbi:MAG TPA: aldehyde dehydrogenase family protein [Candidatus Limnocylindrales bacterium]|nr:aldehyde dehydrogenase family protein [Candidatus Limnocylindrales bacterium]